MEEFLKGLTLDFFSKGKDYIAYSFLPALSFENVKMFDATIGELADALKPGFVAKLYE